jgi:hypothetical protein
MKRPVRIGLTVLRVALVISVLFSGWSTAAGKDFAMPRAQAARSYPAHDEHSDEKVTVAVDPYDMADKAQIFSVNYRDYGYLPVFLIITNDGDQPVSINSMQPTLITVKRAKLSPASNDDLFRRISHPAPRNNPMPIPLPGGKVKGAVKEKARDEIERAQFSARAVEPHSTVEGFLFFDVSDISTPLAGANFFLTGLRNANGNELMYFEIAMEKYLSAPEAKKP